MSDFVEVKGPDGSVFSIAPLTQGKIKLALKALSRQGIVVDSNASNLLTGLEFQSELVKAVLGSWTDPDGNKVQDPNKVLAEHPKIVAYISNKSKELADALDSSYDEDLKN